MSLTIVYVCTRTSQRLHKILLMASTVVEVPWRSQGVSSKFVILPQTVLGCLLRHGNPGKATVDREGSPLRIYCTLLYSTLRKLTHEISRQPSGSVVAETSLLQLTQHSLPDQRRQQAGDRGPLRNEREALDVLVTSLFKTS